MGDLTISEFNLKRHYNKITLKESTWIHRPDKLRDRVRMYRLMRTPKLQEVSFCETLCLMSASRLLSLSSRLHWSVRGRFSNTFIYKIIVCIL